jgi:hypothetical protein
LAGQLASGNAIMQTTAGFFFFFFFLFFFFFFFSLLLSLMLMLMLHCTVGIRACLLACLLACVFSDTKPLLSPVPYGTGLTAAPHADPERDKVFCSAAQSIRAVS